MRSLRRFVKMQKILNIIPEAAGEVVERQGMVFMVFLPRRKDIESRKTKRHNPDILDEFEGPTEDEIDRVSEGFRGMF